MSLYRDLKQIPNRKKKTVYGYLHELEKQFKLRATPAIICCYCLLFSRDIDFFDKNNVDTNIVKILNNNKTISYIPKYPETLTDYKGTFEILCNKWIDSKDGDDLMAKWTIKIDDATDCDFGASCKVSMGIWIGLKDHNGDTYIKLASDGTISSDLCNNVISIAESITFKKGDTISLILDFEDKNIFCRIQGGNMRCLLPNAIAHHRKYKFFIGINSLFGAKLSLIDFSIVQC